MAYANLDTEIVSSSDASQIGNEAAFAPDHTASVWLEYDASDLIDGLSVGAGVRYVSASFSTQDKGRRTPAHTLTDMAIRYEAGACAVSLMVNSLFDEDYSGVCYDG